MILKPTERGPWSQPPTQIFGREDPNSGVCVCRRPVGENKTRGPLTTHTDRDRLKAPHDWFGFTMGSDRRLARWPAMIAYFRYLASSSDRMRYEEIGSATLGQPMVLLTISSPENLSRQAHLQDIQQRLADPRRTTAPERGRLMSEGRVICMVTCAIHATEVGSAQMTPELVHDILTRSDPDTLRMLSEVVLLLVPSMNPDGMETVADWYDASVGTPAEGSPPPAIYHPYAGHDNNRDWVVQTQVETKLVVRRAHRPWRPHIVLDLHQMQSNGPRYVVPPYIDPYDSNIDPLLRAEINALGTSVVAELTAAGKQGVATSIIFDAYAPARAYAHYHGGVRILAEAASVRIASPISVATEQMEEVRGFDPRVALQNHLLPWTGGRWALRDIVDYHLIAVRAVLDHAARWRDRWVRNFTLVQERSLLSDGPSAFVVPSLEDQPDPGTTIELLDILIDGNVEVWQTGAPFQANGRSFTSGSYVIPIAQPFGRYAKTILEIQRYPETAATVPYDVVGHTLSLQFGVRCHQITTMVGIPMTQLRDAPKQGPNASNDDPTAPVLVAGCGQNAAFRLANLLQTHGGAVGRLSQSDDGPASEMSGAFSVLAGSTSDIPRMAGELNVRLHEYGDLASAQSLRAPRVGVYRSWKSNGIDEGWTRFVLEDYRFDCTTLRDQAIRAGHLRRRYDVIVLPHQSTHDLLEGNSPSEYPAKFAGGLGHEGMQSLRRFVDDGGTLVGIDGVCDALIRQFTLPVRNVLDGVPRETFFCPGSILRVLVDQCHPIGWGYQREASLMYINSPAFEIRRGAVARSVAWYPPDDQLLSGMLNGGELIAGQSAIVDIRRGRGRVVLFGFRPLFRAQMRATYRFLFNTLFLSTQSADAAGTVERHRH